MKILIHMPGPGKTAGWLIFFVLAMTALTAPLLAPRTPLETDLGHRLEPPSLSFPLGTDQLGRCVLSRIIFGARISMSAALTASLLSLALGGIIGVLAALARGVPKFFLTAVIDVGLAVPGLILTLVIAGLLGGTMTSLILGLIAANWPWWARLIRGLTLSALQREYVLAGQAAGIKKTRLVTHYILPQMKAPVMAAAALKTGRVILAFSGLSYLGLGPAPPAPEWGRMLQEATIYMTRAPWLIMAPGMAITLVVTALNLIGKGSKIS